MYTSKDAPGFPGITPHWTSSAKDGIGTSLSIESRIWFSVSHGIVNEVYYPRIDIANTRDIQFIVTDGKNFFSEERRDTIHEMKRHDGKIPAFEIRNSCKRGYYEISKTVITDHRSDVLLQKVKFRNLKGIPLKIFVLISPHVKNLGRSNNAWVGDYKGSPSLYAERENIVLSLQVSTGFTNASSGYVGISDGWQILKKYGYLAETYERSLNGNVALIAEINPDQNGEFTVALGFGENPAEAGQKARLSLQRGFDNAYEHYVEAWDRFLHTLSRPSGDEKFDLYDVSCTVIEAHRAKGQFPGAMIASLSIPWGNSKSDEDLGGYHLVWPRDMVESAEALIAAGDFDTSVKAMEFLKATQESDGHWNQNMWLDGSPYWQGIQMDETAFPIILADMLKRNGTIKAEYAWDMVRKAAQYIASYGPVTQQDRWEEDGGFSPFTIAAEIAGLLCAADFAHETHNHKVAEFLRETADIFNSNIERWIYATETETAKKYGVDGYYVRIAPPDSSIKWAGSAMKGFVPIKNRPSWEEMQSPENIISTDALALVRFGLRRADDPGIVNTVKIIDSILKAETPTGPVWHRYNHDGYGEHKDGSPFDGTGTGRGWPLLSLERGHYELALGNREKALELIRTVRNQTSPGGFLPEQIWDSPDIPERGLYNGKPSGSAMPLVWAHAEYIKLAKSIKDNRIFDMPPQTYKRYIEDKKTSDKIIWSFTNKVRSIEQEMNVRIQVLAKARIHWSDDGWKTTHDTETTDSGIGIHYADLKTGKMKKGEKFVFTFFWTESGNWEGKDFTVTVE